MISSITPGRRQAGLGRRAGRTASMKPGVRNCRADTLTLTYGACRPIRCPVAGGRDGGRACTQSPIGTMSPDSSATSMNSVGDNRPRLGCSHRSSASKPTGSPFVQRHDRLVVAASNASSLIACSKDGADLRAAPARRCASRLVPAPLALAAALGDVQREVGVAQQVLSASLASSAVVATPMLAPHADLMAADVNGWDERAMSRRGGFGRQPPSSAVRRAARRTRRRRAGRPAVCSRVVERVDEAASRSPTARAWLAGLVADACR